MFEDGYIALLKKIAVICFIAWMVVHCTRKFFNAIPKILGIKTNDISYVDLLQIMARVNYVEKACNSLSQWDTVREKLDCVLRIVNVVNRDFKISNEELKGLIAINFLACKLYENEASEILSDDDSPSNVIFDKSFMDFLRIASDVRDELEKQGKLEKVLEDTLYAKDLIECCLILLYPDLKKISKGCRDALIANMYAGFKFKHDYVDRGYLWFLRCVYGFVL